MSPPQNRAAIFASTVTFIALAAVAWDRLEYGAYTTWDEFSHWGRIGKALSASHALPTATTGILFKDAPPAPAFCSVVPAARTPQQRAVATNFGHASDQASLGQYGNGTIDATGVWTGGRSRLRPPSVPDWFVCLTGLSILTMLLMPRGARMTLALVHAALCLGCVAYLARLLYLYLYGFRNYEAVRVISFGRYATPMVSGLGPRHHRCAGTGGTGKTTPVRGFRDRVDPLGRVEWNAGSAASQPVGVSDRARGRSLLGHVPDSLRGRCERREPICAALRENRHKDSDIEVGRCPSQPLTDT